MEERVRLLFAQRAMRERAAAAAGSVQRSPLPEPIRPPLVTSPAAPSSGGAVPLTTAVASNPSGNHEERNSS
jgi:hypothetical protein